MKVIPKIEKIQDSNQVKKAEGKKGAVETPAFGQGKDRGFFKDYNDVSQFSIQSKKQYLQGAPPQKLQYSNDKRSQISSR